MNQPMLPFAPASERNRAPILEALRPRMPSTGCVLEIGAGTGQHAVHFAQAFPGLQWLATDRADELPGLSARLETEGGINLLPPRVLDVSRHEWPPGPFQAAFTANTTHIMPWSAVLAMLEGVGTALGETAPFFVYGPFKVDGRFTTESNRIFDQQLRTRAAHMGLRELGTLESEAASHHMRLEERLEMPANNFLLVFRSTRSVQP
jgi:hypothetical protein